MSFMLLYWQAAAQPGTALSIHQRPGFAPETFHSQRFGHRGGYAAGPENTLALLAHNVTHHQMRAAEVDLQLTRDGHLVLFHDPTVARVLDTDVDACVADLTLAQLQAIPFRDRRLGEVFVATLADLLAWFQQQHRAGVPVMLELDFKPHGLQAPLAANRLMAALTPVNEAMEGALERHLFVSTFYPEVLREIRKYSKTLVLGFSFNSRSPEHPILGRIAALLAGHVVRKYACRIICPNLGWLSPRRVARWKRNGYLVHAYPADTVQERAYLDQFGIAYSTSLVAEKAEQKAYFAFLWS